MWVCMGLQREGSSQRKRKQPEDHSGENFKQINSNSDTSHDISGVGGTSFAQRRKELSLPPGSPVLTDHFVASLKNRSLGCHAPVRTFCPGGITPHGTAFPGTIKGHPQLVLHVKNSPTPSLYPQA